ncbi:MAG TPA: BlaI/MecI/CopY family transcriptional regulator [Candidatus Gastranaerophilaceae bacterium]|nr:BlaI/MecI/CopY family transcriptional regulator [Candidatus Gastranaerophilaceae bacterium]
MIGGVLEIEIMNCIWSLQKQDEDANISVADVVAFLSRNKVKRAYTTIKTVMDRLSAKGLLARYKSGKKFFYRSTLDREEAAKDALKEVSTQFFGGNYVEMIKFIEKECSAVLV